MDQKPFLAAEMKSVQELKAGNYRDVLRPLKQEEFSGLKEDIAERGILNPILITRDGTVVDGHHRLAIARQLDFAEVPVIIEWFESDEAALVYIMKNQANRRNLSPAERDEIIGRRYHQLKKLPHRPKKGESSSLLSRPKKTADIVARGSGISPDTVKNAARRVKLTDKYHWYKGDSTKEINLLRKALNRLDKSHEDSFMHLAEINLLNAKLTRIGALLVVEAGLDQESAIAMVMKDISASWRLLEMARKRKSDMLNGPIQDSHSTDGTFAKKRSSVFPPSYSNWKRSKNEAVKLINLPQIKKDISEFPLCEFIRIFHSLWPDEESFDKSNAQDESEF